jgi:hypothetical protein
MDKTRTPLTKWFMAMFLLSGDKRGASALAISKSIRGVLLHCVDDVPEDTSRHRAKGRSA